jgi:4-hydroxy-tetrahydrodipicolinate synthase
MNFNNFPLWTALITPFNNDLTVDYISLKKLIKEQNDANNGILILGSTGEALNICLEDRKEIINFISKIDLNVPVMAGVGGSELAATTSWINFLETKNIDAYLLVTPHYAKPGDEGQYHWFKTLMDTSTRACMLYNVPGRTGTSLSLIAVSKLKDHVNFWAIKEASGSVEKFKEYLVASGNGFVYCGDDALFPEFCEAGAGGLISVVSNVWPLATQLYVKQNLAKSFADHKLWQNASATMFLASNPVPAKAILQEQNRIINNTMMPPLSADDLVDLKLIHDANTKINNWYQEQFNRGDKWTTGKQL